MRCRSLSRATAIRFGILGVAAGVWADGREIYACHGVTSVDNPLPVDQDTLYVLGSATKTAWSRCVIGGQNLDTVELGSRQFAWCVIPDIHPRQDALQPARMCFPTASLVQNGQAVAAGALGGGCDA
jgi:hypothetical protein